MVLLFSRPLPSATAGVTLHSCAFPLARPPLFPQAQTIPYAAESSCSGTGLRPSARLHPYVVVNLSLQHIVCRYLVFYEVIGRPT